MECDEVPLILEEEFQDLSLIKKNELAIEEDPSLKNMQVEKKHPEIIIENVLVEVEDLNFPIDSLTFGIEEDRQASFIERPCIATSQVWIDGEHGEMTLLIGKKKMKFDLHQSIPLIDEERRAWMKIKSLFSPIKEHTPRLLQEDTLERFELKINYFPTKESAFEITSHNMEVAKFILADDEDE